MHASLGFTRNGVMRAVGLKFGRLLDVVIMQRPLGDDADPSGTERRQGERRRDQIT